jgi:hypothetical protein
VVYIITANEGDSRDYDGYSEEERVKDLDLDPTVFPYASTLQQDENMGRLKTTSSMGDLDGDGDFDEIYSFGGRSFSIFDQYGNLVWDAGNQFSTIIKAMEPNLFNEDGGEMDGRSDDKGGEPEAMAIGKIGVYTYAFIGLERQSCIMVYDITDPKKPIFITYYSNRMVNGTNVSGDVGPEIIKFIPATASPNGENLLLVGYEVSGSLGVIQVGGELLMSISETLRNPIGFKAYPNPAQGGVVHFNKTITAEVYDYQGRMITSFEDQSEINTEGWTQGIYTIRSSENGTIRILVLP